MIDGRTSGKLDPLPGSQVGGFSACLRHQREELYAFGPLERIEDEYFQCYSCLRCHSVFLLPVETGPINPYSGLTQANERSIV
jgi:hypothetical protein